jgi:hypothetical protein
MAAFVADPERVFEEAGLTPDERDAVRSRGAERLNAALGGGQQMQGNTNNGAAKVKRGPARKKRPAGKKKGATKKGGRKKTGGSRKSGGAAGSKKR